MLLLSLYCLLSSDERYDLNTILIDILLLLIIINMLSCEQFLLHHLCNELGVCQGPISHNNEQTQSVEGII